MFLFFSSTSRIDKQPSPQDSSQRCWRHPLSGVTCEDMSCGSGRRCAPRGASWSSHNGPDVCELQESLKWSTQTRQNVSLASRLSSGLMSLCDQMKCRWRDTLFLSFPCQLQGCPWHRMSNRTEVILILRGVLGWSQSWRSARPASNQGLCLSGILGNSGLLKGLHVHTSETAWFLQNLPGW